MSFFENELHVLYFFDIFPTYIKERGRSYITHHSTVNIGLKNGNKARTLRSNGLMTWLSIYELKTPFIPFNLEFESFIGQAGCFNYQSKKEGRIDGDSTRCLNINGSKRDGLLEIHLDV